MKRAFVLICMAVILSGAAWAQGFTVSGTVSCPRNGTVFIKLLNKDEYNSPEKCVFKLALIASATGDQNVSFRFDGVPSGVYAIRCFLDTNGNGALDMGLFGPIEPYGFFRAAPAKAGPPEFADVSFRVEKNLGAVRVVLK